jgi:hypothetical protein
MPSILPPLLLGGATIIGAAVVARQMLQAAQENAALRGEQQKHEENARKIAVAREAQAAAERVAASKKFNRTAASNGDPLLNAERVALVAALLELRAKLESALSQSLPGVLELPLLQEGTQKESALLAALLLWGDWRAVLELAWGPIVSVRTGRDAASPALLSAMFLPPDARAVFGNFSFAGRLGFAASALDEPSACAISSWLQELQTSIMPPAPLNPRPIPAAPLVPAVVARLVQMSRDLGQHSRGGTECIVQLALDDLPRTDATFALLSALGLYAAWPEQFEFSCGMNSRKEKMAGRRVLQVQEAGTGSVVTENRVAFGAMFLQVRPAGSRREPDTHELSNGRALIKGRVLVSNFDSLRGFKCKDAKETHIAGGGGRTSFSCCFTPGTIFAHPVVNVTDTSVPAYAAAVTALHARFLIARRARLLLQRLPTLIIGWSFEHCAAATGDPAMHGLLASPPLPDFVQDMKDSEIATLALGVRAGGGGGNANGGVAGSSAVAEVLRHTLLTSVLPPHPVAAADVPYAAGEWDETEERAAAQARIQRAALEQEVELFVTDYLKVRAE